MSGLGNWQGFPNTTDEREATPQHRGKMSRADKVKLDTYPDDAGNIFDAVATDANSWEVQYLPSGKRLWAKRWTDVTAPAATNDVTVTGGALPVGVTNLGDVDCACTIIAANNTRQFLGGIEGDEATTTLRVVVGTRDNSTNMSALTATYSVFVELRER